MKTMTLKDALKFYPSFAQEDISMLTGLPISAVRKAIKEAGMDLSNELTEAWKREMMLEDLSKEQIAKKHHTTTNLVHRALYFDINSGQCGRPGGASHQEIINYMVANRGKFTQYEIAAHFGVAQSLVAKLNPYKQPYGPIKRKTPGEWYPIIEYAKKHSIQAAALLYKVSRASIYRRLEDERAANNKTTS